jgi:hypothetical protein
MLVLLMTGNVASDSFRCKRSLVKVGDSTNVLLKKCGDPLRKFSGKQTVNDQGRQTRVSVSNLVYERSGKKDIVVSIHNGAVLKIQSD